MTRALLAVIVLVGCAGAKHGARLGVTAPIVAEESGTSLEPGEGMFSIEGGWDMDLRGTHVGAVANLTSLGDKGEEFQDSYVVLSARVRRDLVANDRFVAFAGAGFGAGDSTSPYESVVWLVEGMAEAGVGWKMKPTLRLELALRDRVVYGKDDTGKADGSLATATVNLLEVGVFLAISQ